MINGKSAHFDVPQRRIASPITYSPSSPRHISEHRTVSNQWGRWSPPGREPALQRNGGARQGKNRIQSRNSLQYPYERDPSGFIINHWVSHPGGDVISPWFEAMERGAMYWSSDHLDFGFSISLKAFSATWSAVKPNFLNNTLYGAEDPKWSMPITSPLVPT